MDGRTSSSVRDSFTKYAFVEKKKKTMRNKNTLGADARETRENVHFNTFSKAFKGIWAFFNGRNT